MSIEDCGEQDILNEAKAILNLKRLDCEWMARRSSGAEMAGWSHVSGLFDKAYYAMKEALDEQSKALSGDGTGRKSADTVSGFQTPYDGISTTRTMDTTKGTDMRRNFGDEGP